MSEISSHGAQGQHSPFLWPFPEPFWTAPCDSSTFSGKRGNPLCRLELRVTVVAAVVVQSQVTSGFPWTAAHRLPCPSWSLLKLMSIELVMPFSHLILCHPLLLLPSVFPSIRVFSNESALFIRWPKYWSFSISPLC